LESAPVPLSNLGVQIALLLEEAILLGKLKSGERIIEAEVAAEMGTSNGPVREAFRELENLGLVISVPRRGTFVTEFNVQLAREVYSFRALLESAAVRTILPTLRDQDVDRFQRVVDEMGRFPDGPTATPRGSVDVDLQFHDLLFALGEHRLLRQAWERLRVQAKVFLLVTGILGANSTPNEGERATSMVDIHQPLVDALRARNPSAEQLFVEHLAEGERRIVRKMAPLAEGGETLVDRLVKGIT
jgi:DNA-binding GntR family transcriptional regulator